jgi:hypothetical protein
LWVGGRGLRLLKLLLMLLATFCLRPEDGCCLFRFFSDEADVTYVLSGFAEFAIYVLSGFIEFVI